MTFQTIWLTQEIKGETGYCLWAPRPHDAFTGNDARECTCIGWHLKERFLRGTITRSEMVGKQSIQARNVYCYRPFSFLFHRSFALSSIAIFVVKRLLIMWGPITCAVSFLSDSEASDTRERAWKSPPACRIFSLLSGRAIPYTYLGTTNIQHRVFQVSAKESHCFIL